MKQVNWPSPCLLLAYLLPSILAYLPISTSPIGIYPIFVARSSENEVWYRHGW